VNRQKGQSRRAEAIGWAAFLVFVAAVFRLRRAIDPR
jgi:hypothetical protein